MKRQKGQKRKSAIRILEQSVQIFKNVPVKIITNYYLGSIPFVLGLLYFIGDMSRSANAMEYCAQASLGLALLFVWMKCWQAIFSNHVLEYIENKPFTGVSLKRFLRLAATQTLVQSTGLFILPFSLLTMTTGWCYAFYQSVTALSGQVGSNKHGQLKEAWQQAKLWPWQNHIIIGILLVVFGAIIFINISVFLYLIPGILKRYLGIETIFSLSGSSFLNTTFIMTSLGITYLCIDPFIKTAYVLRCYYGASIKNGDDLKSELNRLKTFKKMSVLLIIMLAVSWVPSYAAAATPVAGLPHFTSPPGSVNPEALDQSISDVLEKREFTWRMPRDQISKKEKTPPGPIRAFFDSIFDFFDGIFTGIGDWIEDMIERIRKLFPEEEPKEKKTNNKFNWISSARVLVIVVIVLAVTLLVFFFTRFKKRRDIIKAEVETDPVAAAPDLNSDAVTADDLPVRNWLDLAKN